MGNAPQFRKTVATLISERVDAETASQQLGHSSPAITWEFYILKPATAADAAHVLEELARTEGDGVAARSRTFAERVRNSAFGFKGRTGSDPAFMQVRAGSIGRADSVWFHDIVGTCPGT
jgi:hypothetical protein